MLANQVHEDQAGRRVLMTCNTVGEEDKKKERFGVVSKNWGIVSSSNIDSRDLQNSQIFRKKRTTETSPRILHNQKRRKTSHHSKQKQVEEDSKSK